MVAVFYASGFLSPSYLFFPVIAHPLPHLGTVLPVCTEDGDTILVFEILEIIEEITNSGDRGIY
ncbi:MAG: hypothetical protein C4549_02375 [Deltaproteobacteria bacterium]|jgi:hypothetical protein|nr:MAG: hypothetical protein C4549_02375 [Deltaproteobacteria bacterium]